MGSYTDGFECVYEYVGDNHRWSETEIDIRLLFEVKSEIRSIGELMRQLQLYRSTDSFRNISTKLIVVAPPHADAKRICNEQGVHFLEYPQP